MATQRLIRNLTNTATGGTVAADDYLALSGATNDGRKILVSEVANYVATEEGGSTLAQLSSGKVPASQLPSGFDAGNYLGLWDANANSPALSNGSGTQGDYYIVGTAGSTSIDGISSWAVGDEIRANASAWEKLTPGTTAVTQGGTGATTAEGARTNLEVDSKDEAAEGLTRGEPSLFFNGSNEYVSVADNAALSFTDGTDDLPFSIVAWVKASDATSFNIAGKWGSGSNREYQFNFNGSDKLQLLLQDSSSNQTYLTADTASTSFEGKWVFVAGTFSGAGPSSTNAFNAAADGITLYINGKAIAATATNNGSYAGMSDTSEAFRLGLTGGAYAEGEIRNVQLFNVALTAAQVEQVYRSGVPFELSQASATATYTSDFTSNSVDGWTTFNGSPDATLTVGSDSDNLAIQLDTTSGHHHLQKASQFTVGKRYLVSFDYYCPSGQSNVDGFAVGDDSTRVQYSVTSATTDSWTRTTGDFIPNGTALRISPTDGGATLYQDAGGDDVLYIRNVVVKEAGAILDINAADATMSGSNINLPDRSGNGFNGTSSGMTIADNAVNLPAAVSTYHSNPASGEALLTLGNGGSGDDFSVTEDWFQTWTPGVTFGGGNTGMTLSVAEGTAVKVGKQITVGFAITFTAKGSSTGNAAITGLPATGRTLSASTYSAAIGRFANASGLDSAVSGVVDSNGTGITLFDHSATGASAIDHSNFTDTTIIRGTVTYFTD